MSVMLTSPLTKVKLSLGLAHPGHPPVEAAVLDRLGQVGGADGVAAVEVGDGAGHLEHAVERARREAELLEGGVEQRPAGRDRRRRSGGAARVPWRSWSASSTCGPKRSAWTARAAATRRATVSVLSPAEERSSFRLTAGTSTCRSMRSSSGPETRPR